MGGVCRQYRVYVWFSVLGVRVQDVWVRGIGVCSRKSVATLFVGLDSMSRKRLAWRLAIARLPLWCKKHFRLK